MSEPGVRLCAKKDKQIKYNKYKNIVQQCLVMEETQPSRWVVSDN